jgi:hypothetical protein
MRCCASPTTFTAADVHTPPVTLTLRQAQGSKGDTPAEQSARDVMSAVLFREILKPLARGLGPVGEIALGAVADDFFVRRRVR